MRACSWVRGLWMRGNFGARAAIGARFAVAALIAIVAPGGASKPYPARRLSIMAPAAAGGGGTRRRGRFSLVAVPLVQRPGRGLQARPQVDPLLIAVAAFVLPHIGVLRGRTCSDED